MRWVTRIDGATVVGFDFADTTAAVARARVTVVAVFACLIEDPITACGRCRARVGTRASGIV